MNFPLFIAKRYLISKKSRNIINIISAVSVVGILVGTMALVIVLSVTNGFQELATSLFNVFDPDLKVSPSQGKTFTLSEEDLQKLRQVEGVESVTQILEETALVKYGDKQIVARLKGYDSHFSQHSRIDSSIIDGYMQLQKGSFDYAVMGVGTAIQLNVRLSDFTNSLSIFVPKRNTSSGLLNQAFINKNIIPSGIFSLQQDIDSKYILVPLRFMRELLEIQNELSALEIATLENENIDQIQSQVQQILGNQFTVKNRHQQQELLYKIMKSEKVVTFFILAFIILVASFNIIGSLTILILDKQKDIGVLWSMGANPKTIQWIFMLEGLLITLSGALGGILIGGLISYLQQEFALVQLQSEGSFIIDSYPVKVLWQDILVVFFVVCSIGGFASWISIRKIRPSVKKI